VNNLSEAAGKLYNDNSHCEAADKEIINPCPDFKSPTNNQANTVLSQKVI